MLRKKLLPIVFSAVFAISAAGQALTAGTAVHAKSSVAFYAGSSSLDTFRQREPQKIDAVKVPEKCTVSIYNSDNRREAGTVTASDKKIVSVTKLHQGDGWQISGKKEGKTTLSYKRGSETGQIDAEVLPPFKLSAVKKSAKISGGKVKLTVTYQNNTDTEIVIEGADIGRAQIQYEKDKELSQKEKEVRPVRWKAKKVTIPAGKTKTFTLTQAAKKSSGGIKKFDFPQLYIRYHGVYFATSLQGDSAEGFLEYYGSLPFEEFIS